VIDVAGTLDCVASVADMVRVAKFIGCACVPVVIPVAIVTVQWVFAANPPEATVSCMAAFAAPESEEVAVKVEVPHPLAAGVARAPIENVGSTTLIVSAISNSELKMNCITTSVLAAVMGFGNVTLDDVRVGVGATIADDAMTADAGISVAAERVALIVRLAKFPPCPKYGVSTPLSMVTEQSFAFWRV
jgi:hypothetical protein